MKLWQARNMRIAACAAFLSFSLVACGGGGDDEKPEGKGNDKSSEDSKGTEQDAPAGEVDTSKVIGSLKGPDGVLVDVHSAERDPGGFVTVQATLNNKGSKTVHPNRWMSQETSLKSKSSISGATLIDKKGKKRYMVLRDTDGQCLCTTSIPGTKAGESRPLFAQFPAPPKDVKEADFQIPTMSPATLEITEG